MHIKGSRISKAHTCTCMRDNLVSLAISAPTPITTSDNICGACVSKALTCVKIHLCKQKMEIVSRRLILLVILLYELLSGYIVV